MAQVVEYLLSKHKALNSNSSITALKKAKLLDTPFKRSCHPDSWFSSTVFVG
jgi:hypothetical protein